MPLGGYLGASRSDEADSIGSSWAPRCLPTWFPTCIFGLFESDGWVSREQTGAIRVGYATTSEQLAHQLHWLLLRWGVASSVRRRDPHAQRGGIIKGRRIQGKLPCWEVRVAGVDNVRAFARAVPMWGPRGQVLVQALESRNGSATAARSTDTSPSR